MKRFPWILSLLILVSVAAYADTADRAAYQARLDAQQATLQATVAELSASVDNLPAEKQEAIQKKIIETKRQGEIDRLTILLEWATAEGDQARITEVQQALDSWVNPPAERKLPEISGDKQATTPGQPASTNNAR